MTLRPTAEELVELVELDDVRFFESNGRVEWNSEDERDEAASSANQSTGGIGGDEFEVTLRVGERADDRGIVAFFSVGWSRGRSSASCVVGALYTVREEVTDKIEYDEDALRIFAERVAAFQILPFAREGLIATAARLRISPPPIMPMVPRSSGPGALED